jgi:hypothetical protein
MSPSDPTFVIAASVLLDLIGNNLEHSSTKGGASSFWVEWLAWATLLSVYWTVPFIQKYAASTGISAELEEAAIEEKHKTLQNGVWLAGGLSFCLVATGFLFHSEHERYNWVLVGQLGTMVMMRADWTWFVACDNHKCAPVFLRWPCHVSRSE